MAMNAEPPNELDPRGVDELRRRGAPCQLIDVREPWEVEICAVADSVNIPMSQLPARLGEIARDRPIVVICHHGRRSAEAAAWLRRQGFSRTINLRGGVDAWARDVDPTMPVY